MTDLRAYAREAAARAGCDPDLFVRQIHQESGFDPEAYNAASGASGIAQIVARFHPDVDPWDPRASLDYAATWMAKLQRQYGSYREALAAYNWGPGNVSRWNGERATLPAETRRYLDVILGEGWPEPNAAPAPPPTDGVTVRSLRVTDDGVRLRAEPSTTAPILTELSRGTLVAPVSPWEWRQVRAGGREGWVAADFLEQTQDGIMEPEPAPAEPPRTPLPPDLPAIPRDRFDPTIPTELQVQDWTCSIRSTMWMLKSIGVAVTPAEAQDAMSPRYVNSAVGLLDATGAGIVEVLGSVWGVSSFNRAPVTFDDVAGWAGRCPVAIGGRIWGHWSAVRGYDAERERLVLANPGGTGPRYGQQSLDRQQFAELGWFSAVVIPVE